MAAEFYAEWEYEKQNLFETQEWCRMWSDLIRRNAPTKVIQETEEVIAMVAKEEWGPETLVDFDRSDRLVAIEHPINGLVGLGKEKRI